MIRLSKYIISILFLITSGILLFSAVETAAQSLAYTLQGKILLQVEENGEAWYVYPSNLERYYLGRPADAFEIMRNLGLGISNDNLSKIPTDSESYSYLKHDSKLIDRLSGTILLQVEENGEAWYVYPENEKRYYLGRPADAFQIMRNLGLGISNDNLLGIPISTNSKLPDYGNGNEPEPETPETPELNDGKDGQRTTLLNIMNTERSSKGVAAFSLTKELSQAAQAQVDDMMNQNYFDFTSPQGKTMSDWVSETGYVAHVLAQNLIQTNQGINSLVPTWKSDQNTSYNNVVDPQYREVGIGLGTYQGFPTYIIIFSYSLEDFFIDNTAGLADLNQMRTEMMLSVNEERQKVGLPALVTNDLLNQAAQGHTDDMLGRSYYDHESPEGTTAFDRIQTVGYVPMLAAENIAKGQFSVAEVMQGWMDSPGHRANILGEGYEEVGFGLSFGENQNGYDILWAQNFATSL